MLINYDYQVFFVKKDGKPLLGCIIVDGDKEDTFNAFVYQGVLFHKSKI